MSNFIRVAAAALILAGCATTPPVPPAPAPQPAKPVPVPTPVPTPAPVPDNALLAGVARVDPPAQVDEARAAAALTAFRKSCSVTLLSKRGDNSGLTEFARWGQVCAEAATVVPGQAGNFFRNRFAWLRVGKGEAFATGYYEPEIAGSPQPGIGFDVPIYAKPDDLTRGMRVDGVEGTGRLLPDGTIVPYFTRAEIEDGALAGRGLEIAYAADAADLFFLQVQGSGRVRYPDGTVLRIGYAAQNGREYVAIGKLLRERNLLPPGGATMQGIKDWIRANPEAGKALMRENLSYIFFRKLEGDGPLGAMGIAVSPRATVAADPKYVPLGAPVFLDLDHDEADGIWIAQDTGGAIKGANRFDTFWGAGEGAAATAGGLSSAGSALILIPIEAVSDAAAKR